MPEEKFMCINPNPEKTGTRIALEKYELVKRAILQAVGEGEDGIYFKDLAERVEEILTVDEVRGLGSVSWYTTTVKLDLEARGIIERAKKSSPQRLRLVKQRP